MTRPRKEIEDDFKASSFRGIDLELILEVALDCRDLLQTLVERMPGEETTRAMCQEVVEEGDMGRPCDNPLPCPDHPSKEKEA